nr:hypothetical protein [Propioniciclava sp. MC1683]
MTWPRLVNRALGEELQQLGRPVGRLVRAQQFGTLVDERRRGPPREEVRVGEHAAQEADVGADAADAELRQRPLRPAYRAWASLAARTIPSMSR